MKKGMKKSNDYGGNIEGRKLSIHELVSEQRYQRGKLNQNVINSIVRNFDPHKLGVLKVWHHRGRYYVIDGQHRLTALRMLYSNRDYHVLCEVHNDISYEQAARYCAEQDRNKTPFSPYDKYNALLEAKDPAAMEIQTTLKGLGLCFDRSRDGSGGNVIHCVKTVCDLHKQNPLPDFQNILRLIKESWGGNRKAFDNKVIRGVALFHQTYKGMFSNNRFIEAMRRTDPPEIIRLGNSDYSTGGDLRYARAVLHYYNKGNPRDKLQYRFDG